METVPFISSPLFQETHNDGLINTDTPLHTTSRATMDSNGNLTTITSIANNAYAYIRLSKTGYKGALTRDLVAGEEITIKIKAKSSSTASYIRSSYLDFPKTYFTQTNTYQEFEFKTTVKSNVSNKAWLGLFMGDIGETLTVESIKVIEGI